tara:strand:+ start:140 stop:949 length:810 start_codon:yes stop_codon:yes gene_type:complete
MEKFTPIQNKVNEVSQEFGFREFNFTAEKYDTAQRSLVRFVKAMNNRIAREEIENTQEIKIKLDLVSHLIKKVNSNKFSEEPNAEKLEFVMENNAEQLFEYHKNKLVKYFSNKLAKEVKFNYTILKNYYAYQTFYENEEGAKVLLEKLRDSNKEIFDNIKSLEGTTLENLEEKLAVKDALTKGFSELFNTEVLETALTVCKLHKEKIEEINKTHLAKKKPAGKPAAKKPTKGKPRKSIDMNKVKTNTVKEVYEDKGAENNPFAALLTKK